MANVTLPNLRHTSQDGAGTITVPAGQTWIIKSANARFEHTGAAQNQNMTITATIDSNSAVVWSAGNIDGNGYFAQAGPVFSSTVIMKTGDTLVVAITNVPTHKILNVYYWILESDF